MNKKVLYIFIVVAVILGIILLGTRVELFQGDFRKGFRFDPRRIRRVPTTSSTTRDATSSATRAPVSGAASITGSTTETSSQVSSSSAASPSTSPSSGVRRLPQPFWKFWRR